MEISCQSLSQSKFLSSSSSKIPPSLVSPLFFHSKASLFVSNPVPFHSSKSILTQLKGLRIAAKRQKNLGAIHAAEADQSTTTDGAESWLLEPVGDGDSRHLGYKAPMPDAFEIASSEVTVGRLADKADMVIPVATVSGIHARIQKKGDSLLVTDLDSTNGTFVDDKRLRPGVVASALPGSCITFESKISMVQSLLCQHPTSDRTQVGLGFIKVISILQCFASRRLRRWKLCANKKKPRRRLMRHRMSGCPIVSSEKLKSRIISL